MRNNSHPYLQPRFSCFIDKSQIYLVTLTIPLSNVPDPDPVGSGIICRIRIRKGSGIKV